MDKHPIQLVYLGIRELLIKSNIPPQPDGQLPELEEGKFRLQTGLTDYDEENKAIGVALKLEIGIDDEEECPFSLRIELYGHFLVDDKKFPKDKIQDWALNNAPYILMPYMREQVFALTSRCGFQPVILPLTQVPTSK